MRPENRATRELDLWLRGLTIGIVALYLTLFCVFLFRVGPQDQDQFLVFHQLQAWNRHFFGLAKQWTPLLCSGLSLAGEPQVPFLSLSMAVGYVLSPYWALKVTTLIYFIEGWIGAYLYAGLWLTERRSRALAASLFIGNGFFICRMAYGHIDFIPFLILPLALWTLHRVEFQRTAAFAVAAALLGAMFALAIDGSPVAIIHLLFWIGLYASIVSIFTRRLEPLALFGVASLASFVLDAGYLWPMLKAQTLFPRRTLDSFTSALSLLWFAAIPMRGKVLPANGNGHELSVFIGPVFLWLLWRYRLWLRASMPDDIRVPLFLVSIASVVLGMGSLKALNMPLVLSPFDLLRPLPGFRSIGVTGRYWGFLALPLSLCGAAVLAHHCDVSKDIVRLRVLLALALVFQLGFQLQTVAAQWLPSRPYRHTREPRFVRGNTIDYVAKGERLQGELITPTRGVTDCYDLDDFTHAEMSPGTKLVRAVRVDQRPVSRPVPAAAVFKTWNDISVSLPGATHWDGSRAQVILGQAFHPYWHADGCTVDRTEHGNLVLDCPVARFSQGPVSLSFDDTLSDLSARVSERAWVAWIAVVLMLSLALGVQRLAVSASERGEREGG